MNNDWVEKQWMGAPLGDKRLEKRAIKVGEACLKTPEGTLPKKFGSWADMKGAYRFFDAPGVTHESLQKVHNKNVIEQAKSSKKIVLFIQDGSELIYNKHPCTYGLGPTADAYGKGIMFHTCLAVEWEKKSPPEILGIAKQTPWIRPEDTKKEEEKEHREKESQVWLNSLKAIGSPPEGSRWISVGDRGNDIYEYILGAEEAGWSYVLRAKHNRSIRVAGEKKKLHKWIRNLEPRGEYGVYLRSRGGEFSRDARFKVAWEQVSMLPPLGKIGKEIEVTYVRIWDPEDSKIEWILVTSEEVNSFEAALEIVSIYELRWVIEEYHKCLKSGCRIEEAQLKTGKRLLALFGILGVIATQLLKLRDLSRQEGDKEAEEYVAKVVVDIIRSRYKLQGRISVKELWRRIAMLGGFIGRKSDGEPGWQTIWGGWLRVQDILEGIRLAKNCG